MHNILYNNLKRIAILNNTKVIAMKKCVLVNDLSGFGKCSLAVQLPIISALGIEAHPVPTAFLSNQTAYGSYYCADMTEHLISYLDQWNALGVAFDGVLTGYFASAEAVRIVREYLKNSGAFLTVDPVMGDNGSLYSGFDDELCTEIRKLVLCADMITPNLTELYYLTGERDTEKAAERLLSRGVKSVVVTGVEKDGKIGSQVFSGGVSKVFLAEKTGGYFSGTGDIFSAVLTGLVLKGRSVFEAAGFAGSFIAKVIKNTNAKNAEDGVDFETYLGDLL